MRRVSAPVRIGIVEDDAFVVDALRSRIDEAVGFEVVGTASSVEGLVPLVASHFPDVLLVDVRLGPGDGIAAVAAAARRGMRPKVVLMTAHPDREAVRSALEVGADGFLLKGDLGQHWRLAVESAISGGAFFSPLIGAAIARQHADLDRFEERRRFRASLARLSPIELRVLELLPTGATVPEMARTLTYGTTSVKAAIAGVVEKLGVENRAQASAMYAQHR